MLLLALLATAAAQQPRADGSSSAALSPEAEQALLKLRLKALEDELKEEKKYSYVVVKGYIADASNVFQETMDVEEAKAYCNSNPECKGFTFLGPEEHPEDEVTVTFKDGSRIAHDPAWVSFVKESSMFGALHGAMTLGEAEHPAIISHSLTFESICIVFALLLVFTFVCRRRIRGETLTPGEREGGSNTTNLLPR